MSPCIIEYPSPPEPKWLFNMMRVNGWVGLMVRVGRITPSFRRMLLAEIKRLYKRFRPELRDPRLQEAFDALIKVWSGESAAMMVSNLPLPFDTINLLANVHIKTEVERLKLRYKELWTQASLLRVNEKGGDESE